MSFEKKYRNPKKNFQPSRLELINRRNLSDKSVDECIEEGSITIEDAYVLEFRGSTSTDELMSAFWAIASAIEFGRDSSPIDEQCAKLIQGHESDIAVRQRYIDTVQKKKKMYDLLIDGIDQTENTDIISHLQKIRSICDEKIALYQKRIQTSQECISELQHFLEKNNTEDPETKQKLVTLIVTQRNHTLHAVDIQISSANSHLKSVWEQVLVQKGINKRFESFGSSE